MIFISLIFLKSNLITKVLTFLELSGAKLSNQGMYLLQDEGQSLGNFQMNQSSSSLEVSLSTQMTKFKFLIMTFTFLTYPPMFGPSYSLEETTQNQDICTHLNSFRTRLLYSEAFLVRTKQELHLPSSLVMFMYVISILYSFQSHSLQMNDQPLDTAMQLHKKTEINYLSWAAFKANNFAQWIPLP